MTFTRTFLSVVLLIATASHIQCGQEEISGKNAFESFSEARMTALSQLKSFKIEGTITITTSDVYLKANPGPKISRRTFKAWGSGTKLAVFSEFSDSSGMVVPVEFYMDNARLVEVQRLAQGLAKIFTLGKQSNVGIFNECPAFLEYSYLNGAIDDSGISALRPTDIALPAKWNDVATKVGAASLDNHGRLRISLATGERSCKIILKAADEPGEPWEIVTIDFFDDKHNLDRRLEVLESAESAKFGRIGKSYRVSVFRGDAAEAASVWEYHLTDIKLNIPVDDETLSFDPASVGLIYDGDSKVFINVPK